MYKGGGGGLHNRTKIYIIELFLNKRRKWKEKVIIYYVFVKNKTKFLVKMSRDDEEVPEIIE